MEQLLKNITNAETELDLAANVQQSNQKQMNRLLNAAMKSAEQDYGHDLIFL